MGWGVASIGNRHDKLEIPELEGLEGAIATTGPKVGRTVTRPLPRKPAGKGRASTTGRWAQMEGLCPSSLAQH